MKKLTFEIITLFFSAFVFFSCTQEIETPAEKKLNQVVVTKMPAALLFSVGDRFSISGLELTAYYADGTSEVVSKNEYTTEPQENAELTVETENQRIKIVCFEKEITYSVIVRKKGQSPDSSNPGENEESKYTLLYEFDEENKTASVTGIDGTSSHITIPEKTGVYTVEKIAPFAFMNCTFIKHIVLPETIKEISTQAFTNCTSLEELSLPSELKSIGYNAFGNCENLQLLEVNSKDIEKIAPDFLFQKPGERDASVVGKIVFTDKVERIRSRLWNGRAEEMRVEGASTILEKEAFFKAMPHHFYCNTDVPERLFEFFSGTLELTENVKRIGDSAFSCYFDVDYEKAAVLPDSIEYIGDDAFYRYPVKNIPKNIKYIGEGAFSAYCETELELPESVEYIQSGAFRGCPNLETITIPKSFENVDERSAGIFFCENVKTVVINGNFDYSFCSRCPKISSVIYGEGVTKISDYPTNVEEYTVPEGIEEINDNCFSNVNTLKKITFPSSLKKIGNSVLHNCVLLETVEFTESENSVEIGGNFMAFSFDNNVLNPIEEIHLGKSIKKIGAYFCFGRRNIKSITTEATGLKEFSVAEDESGKKICTVVLGNPGITAVNSDSLFLLPFFYDGEFTVNYTICEGVEIIDLHDLWGDKALFHMNATVSFPQTLKRIDNFDFCGLSSIEIPDGVEYIGDGCFEHNPLTSVKLPASLKTIGMFAFAHCNLKQIEFPEGLESIGSYAFCENSISRISIPASVTDIGAGVFEKNDDVTYFLSKANCEFSAGLYFDTFHSLGLQLNQKNFCIFTGKRSFTDFYYHFSFTSPWALIILGEHQETPLDIWERSKIKVLCFDSSVKKIGGIYSSHYGISHTFNLSVPIVFCSENPPVVYGNKELNSNIYDSSEKIYVPDASLDLYKQVYDWAAEGRILPRSQLPQELEELLCY